MNENQGRPEAPGQEDHEETARQVDAESQTTDAESEQGEDDLVAELQAALQATEQEMVQQREAVLRMQAEMDNLRKRLIRDLERSRKRALEGVMNDLVPVKDSLERGLEAAEESATVESLKEGKALIMKMLVKVMADHGLVELDPKGEPFNPEAHEAMSMLPSGEYPENTVMEVFQKGYQLHDRLIRPARVVVSSGPGNN